ncbi:hypothetical protein HBH56_090840 [Parastagonospora nodorum]|uniref:Uncharacterized protein n=1 Tax=Phaeosphaeria nodorum (strain SN15 / ATCC MYA-4574 / FGSC 10173) TaxID=321614 RepID=A0A7U2F4H2_PHANO|nr:hypothetical protein HBH56_090840 [Parastagonospora nodorum]QRC98256.1 hypothetical protein JI435_303130 [Parastagonospora nodorum SN15]KAH3936381.1 hypothetical protein HBH54_025480 [Parastagonospora nodorum]KAH3989850.1 hypothetical protein HBH52_017790 [Parastagonospora nodorum]KAH4034349.1 hypothetical protein HBI09_109410 [Parastagonospora nodorum]
MVNTSSSAMSSKAWTWSPRSRTLGQWPILKASRRRTLSLHNAVRCEQVQIDHSDSRLFYGIMHKKKKIACY